MNKILTFWMLLVLGVAFFTAFKLEQFVRIEKKINDKMIAIEEMVNIQQEILQDLLQDLRMRMH